MRKTIGIGLLTLFAASVASGQVMIRRGGGGGGGDDILMLSELGVVVGAGEEEGADIQLVAVMPNIDREIRLEQGDLVLMINGKRVRDLATLRAMYDETELGATVKLGFRRGDERFLTSFEKAEAGHGPGGVRMMSIGGSGSEFDDIEAMHEFQALLGEKDGSVVVAIELPMGAPILKQNDRIAKVNGHAVTTLAELREIYTPIAVGEIVELLVVRGDETLPLERAKAEPPAGMMRRVVKE